MDELNELLYLVLQGIALLCLVAAIVVIPTMFRVIGLWWGVGFLGYGQNIDS